MVLVLRDPTIERLARELADRSGDTLTAVVRRVLAAELDRVTREGRSHEDQLVSDILHLADRCARHGVRRRPPRSPDAPDRYRGVGEG